MKRLDLFLLAALVLSWIAQAFWVPPAAFLPGERKGSSWQAQEKRTREEIRRTMTADRRGLGVKLRQDRSLWWRFQIGFLLMGFVAFGILVQWGRLLLRRFRGSPPDQPPGRPPPPEWGPRQIFRFVLIILLLIQCSVLMQAVLFRLFHPAWLDRRTAALADTLLVDLLAAAGVSGFFLKRRRLQGRTFDAGKLFPAIRLAFRKYLFSVPLLALLLFAVAGVLNLLRMEPPPQPIFTLYLSEERTRVVQLLLLLAVVAGPIAEEMFFRGFLYSWLRARVGVARGLFLSAFLFALLHMDPVAFVPILGLGLLFGWVYEETGSLAAPIAIHIFHNAGMLYIASLIKALVSLT